MSFSIGIIGLPNVGKSTLFKALTKKEILIANYPFATIDPNVGVVEVPDNRLDELARVAKSKKIVPTTVDFVDIAGLVRGASSGEGLGNQFLSHIREVEAIVHVVRVFEDGEITHVHGEIDPKSDVGVIHYELIYADLETVERRLSNLEKNIKSGLTKELEKEIELIKRVHAALTAGKLVRDLVFTEDEIEIINELQLLTIKPMIYVLNVSEQMLKEQTYKGLLPDDYSPQIALNVKMEAELVELSEEDAQEMMNAFGLKESGLSSVIREGFDILNLIAFFTAGEMEARAWRIERGTKAPQAAGKIHSDFEKHFIRAEVTNWKDFVDAGGDAGVREKGLLRIEGKDYVIKEGDVVHFRVDA